MIVELRTYTVRPLRAGDFLALYERLALPMQKEHLGHLIGFFVTEVGPLNQVVHLWAYADQAEREQKRDAMQRDPQWQAYLKMNTEAGYMQSMENHILRSTSFSPL